MVSYTDEYISHPNVPTKETTGGENVSHSFITMLQLHLFYMPRRCYFPQFMSAKPFGVYDVFQVSLLLA
jgi:hypothetical protein